MAYNNFITEDGEVLLDLTNDTVTPEVLAEGYTAHNASGDAIVGVAVTGTHTCACEEQIVDLTGKIVQDYYLPWTGKPEYKKGERCTDFIPVNPGWPIELANIYMLGSRSICVYDANKNFLRCLRYGGEDAAITLTIKMPMDAAYMRCSLHSTRAPLFRYVDPLGIRLQLVDDRITNRIDGLETRVNSQLDGLSPYARTIDLTGKIIQDYYLPWSGTPEKNAGDRCTDFIPVKGGYSIYFENANLQGSRSVCVYDTDKNFLRCLRYASEETTFVLNMPTDAVYMRCSVSSTKTPVIRYNGIVDSAVTIAETRLNEVDNLLKLHLDNISPLARAIDLTDKIVQDYYLPWSGNPEYKRGERCTDFVPVKGGYHIRIENAYLEGSRAICVYDADKNFLKCLRYSSEETTLIMKMPADAAYMRCSIHGTRQPVIRYYSIVDSAIALTRDELNSRLEALEALVSELQSKIEELMTPPGN